MELTVPEQPDSVYAAEGTCAHELAEIKLRFEFGLISESKRDARVVKWRKEWDVSEATEFAMDSYTDQYVELIKERQQAYPNTQVMVEQRLDSGLPECQGTSDAVLVSPGHIEIVDLKYGQGIEVEAEGNPQLRLYALGAMETYGDLLGDTEIVRITVHQPRLEHILTDEMTPQALLDWREAIRPIAELALGDDAPFGPSESACRWCPASGACRAQMESIFEDDDLDFSSTPDTLEPEEIAGILKKADKIRDWLAAIEATAFDHAYSKGIPIPGFKVVASGGQRSLINKEEAIEYLCTELGYTVDEVSKTSIRGIGELEALMGVQNFAKKLKKFIKPPTPKPSLVPESDRRSPINRDGEAARVFSDEDLI